MRARTWFGIFNLDKDKIVSAKLFQNDIVVNRLADEPLLLRGKVAGEDLHDLVDKTRFCSFKGRIRMLHELNIRLAKKQRQ